MAKHATVLVEGNSMEPAYSAGDWLMARWADYAIARNLLSKLLHRLHILSYLAPGDAVVIERAEQPGVYFVKRISEAKDAQLPDSQLHGRQGQRQMIYVLSDNPEGTDSRTWGWLPIHYVKARIEFRVKRSKNPTKKN